jgi:hypothetical protein
MSDTGRWLNWKPSGWLVQNEVESGTKPTKPSKPPGTETALEKVAPATAPPPGFGDLSMDEISAYARIGSDAPPDSSPAGQPTGRFDGFDGFVAQCNRKNVIEVRRHPSGLMVFQPVTRAGYPEPTGFKTVASGVGSDEVRYTVVQHHIKGPNHVGQDGAEFPFCLVNLAAWRRGPVDLRLVHWFRTERDAMSRYLPPAPPPPEPLACFAMFAGGVQVELRRENRSRWQMWEVRSGHRTRRTDFSSPWLGHSQTTARQWYGEPLTDWVELQENPVRAKARPRSRGNQHGSE